jgi:hypothetical protein
MTIFARERYPLDDSLMPGPNFITKSMRSHARTMADGLTVRRYQPADENAVWRVHERAFRDASIPFDPELDRDLRRVPEAYLGRWGVSRRNDRRTGPRTAGRRHRRLSAGRRAIGRPMVGRQASGRDQTDAHRSRVPGTRVRDDAARSARSVGTRARSDASRLTHERSPHRCNGLLPCSGVSGGPL